MVFRCLVLPVLVLGLVTGGAGADMATIFPQLRDMKAPDWVKPGVRLVYYASAATVPGSYEHFKPDKDGNWIDQRTGQRYSKEATGSGKGGHGLTTIDIAAVDARQAALSIRSWLLTPPGLMPSVLVPGPYSSAVGAAAGPSDWYIHPAVLGGLKEGTRADVKVLRLTWPLGDKQYRAVALEYKTAQARFSSVYDLETGLLLSHTGSVDTAGDQTMLTYGRFLGQRQMALPWRTNDAPDWLATVKSIEANGGQFVALPGTPMLQLPVRVTNTVTGRGTNWIGLHQTTTTGTVVPGMPPSTSEGDIVCGPGQVGGLWLPPGALTKLADGQELDTDALTGTSLRVGQATGAEVTLVETGAVHTTAWTYRLSDGMLTQMRHNDRSLANQTLDVRVTDRR